MRERETVWFRKGKGKKKVDRHTVLIAMDLAQSTISLSPNSRHVHNATTVARHATATTRGHRYQERFTRQYQSSTDLK